MDLDGTDTGGVIFASQVFTEDGRSLDTELVRLIRHSTFHISSLCRTIIGLLISMMRTPEMLLFGRAQTREMGTAFTLSQ